MWCGVVWCGGREVLVWGSMGEVVWGSSIG